jgi:putative lipoic acid-binding regulatory protein
MTTQQPPKIEFPCPYPLKVVGDAAPDFADFVVEVISRHGEISERVEVIPSSNGRFQSVRITLIATGEPQLAALHAELKGSGRVHIVI